MDNKKIIPGTRFTRCRRGWIFMGWFLCLSLGCGKTYAQFYSVSVDGVALATTTFNVEGSMALHNKWSLHLPVQYNPWTFSGNKKIKQIAIQPGIRYWFGDSYSPGWFIGLNAVVDRYNRGGFLGSRHRRDGWGYGPGISGGYVIPLHRRWNIEFEAGVSAIWSRYDKYRCETCGEKLEDGATGWFIQPGKAAVKLVFLF